MITIAAVLHCVLTFDLYESIKQLVKLLLVYQKVQKLLDFGYYKTYIKNATTLSLLEIEYKSAIDAVSP